MNKYNIDINISVTARDQIEANEKFIAMLDKLSLLFGYTTEKKSDVICDDNNVLNFSINKE